MHHPIRSTRRRGALLAAALVLTAAPATAVRAATPGPGRLTGTVRLAGKPLPGATVTLTLLRGLDAPVGPYRQEPTATAITSAAGVFTLPLDVTPAVLDLASRNSNFVNYTVQAFANAPATTVSQANVVRTVLGALAAISPTGVQTALAHPLPTGTVPSAALTAIIDTVVGQTIGSPPSVDAFRAYAAGVPDPGLGGVLGQVLSTTDSVQTVLDTVTALANGLKTLVPYVRGVEPITDELPKPNGALITTIANLVDSLVTTLVNAIPDYQPYVNQAVTGLDAATATALAAVGDATATVTAAPPAAIATASPAVATAVDAVTALMGPTLVQLLGTDPTVTVAEIQGQAYSAADLGYSLLKGTGALGTVDDLAQPVLTAPDPVTLEMTAVEAANVTAQLATSMAGQTPGNSGQCRPRYAPYVTIEQRENSMDPVGEAHVMYDSTANFEYGEHSNTDLNGAYSYDGGNWSVTYTANHMGNKAGMIRKPFTAHQAYVVHSGFRYRKERLEFTDDYGDGHDGHVCRIDHRIVPEGWVSGYILGADVTSKDSAGQMDAARGNGRASLYRGVGEFEKNTAKGYKYHTGVEAFGVGLYAESTWSAQVDVHWTFGSHGDHWLYGSDNNVMDAKNVYAW